MKQTIVGSPLYMPPEMLTKQNYSLKCDIWSLGLIYFELLHFRTPWLGNTPTKLVENIRQFDLKIKQDVSYNSRQFLIGCLEKNAERRFTWEMVFEHPIFNGRFKAHK